MKDVHKDPILYYILVPVFALLWPLLVWTVYLPQAQESWEDEKNQYETAKKYITEILELDRERLNYADPSGASSKFDYADAVEKAASQVKISSADYRTRSGAVRPSKGQKSQAFKVVLQQIDITRSAEFLSALQLRWANLQCERIKFTQKKGLVDRWEVDLDFKYYY